ncbi:putative queuosine biosynthesis protein QueE [Pseudomonas phage PIP]|nr:putative queuosine biosynthesis protein QueE [Pseudomonas phage PIP]
MQPRADKCILASALPAASNTWSHMGSIHRLVVCPCVLWTSGKARMSPVRPGLDASGSTCNQVDPRIGGLNRLNLQAVIGSCMNSVTSFNYWVHRVINMDGLCAQSSNAWCGTGTPEHGLGQQPAGPYYGYTAMDAVAVVGTSLVDYSGDIVIRTPVQGFRRIGSPVGFFRAVVSSATFISNLRTGPVTRLRHLVSPRMGQQPLQRGILVHRA